VAARSIQHRPSAAPGEGMRTGRALSMLLLLSLPPGTGAASQAGHAPAAVAARLQARFERISDYDCVMRTATRSGQKKVEAAAFHIWYRRPGLLRLRVLQGRHKGSELVMGADGTLRGRRGGLLRRFSRRLSRSDRSLRSLRGQPAWELDFGSFLRAMRQRLALPGSTAVVREPTAADPHLILEVRYRPPDAAGSLRDVWYVDPHTWLLARGNVFEGETQVDHFEITDIRIDQGLGERWFRF
jgi:outer membrane lipoprotein-sorting protein